VAGSWTIVCEEGGCFAAPVCVPLRCLDLRPEAVVRLAPGGPSEGRQQAEPLGEVAQLGSRVQAGELEQVAGDVVDAGFLGGDAFGFSESA
jgi:hypothetical protein